MTGAPPPSAEIPAPRDDDDDDVAWALHTAQVQWKRSAHADAVVWLQRAAESAASVGNLARAAELNWSAAQLSQHALVRASEASPPAAMNTEIDQLSRPPSRYSAPMPSIPIDIEVELERMGSENDTERSLTSAAPLTPPPVMPAGAPDKSGPRSVGPRSQPQLRPPPPPPRALRASPPPPPPSRPTSRAPMYSEPSFVTSAPPIEEVLKQAATGELFPVHTDFVTDSRPRSERPSGSQRPERQPTPFDEAGGGDGEPLRELQLDLPEDLPSSRRLPSTPADPDTFPPESPTEVSRTGPVPAEARASEQPSSAPAAESMPPSDTLQSADFDAQELLRRGAPHLPTPAPPSVPGIDLSQSQAPRRPSRFPAQPPAPRSAEDITVGGVPLSSVRGLQDLPEDAQRALVLSSELQTLSVDEEINNFGVALVVEGWVTIMPSIADAACAHATKGDVVFTSGTLADGIALRVVAGQEGTTVAVWQAEALESATQSCPWVADELRLVADRFQALAGVTMGALGDRLDDALRALVTDRCDVRTLLPFESLVEKASPLPGLHIIAGGRVEIIVESVGGGGEVDDELGPGDFLFAPQVLGGAPAPATARAGKSGALVLFADRMTTHELLVSVPPLLEILAG